MSFPNSEAMERAKQAAVELMGCYSKIPASEAQIFVAKLVELLMHYPGMEARIASPINGIPAKFKFFPSLADIKEELNEWRVEWEQAKRFENWGRQERLSAPEETPEQKAANVAKLRAASEAIRASLQPFSRKVSQVPNDDDLRARYSHVKALSEPSQ